MKDLKDGIKKIREEFFSKYDFDNMDHEEKIDFFDIIVQEWILKGKYYYGDFRGFYEHYVSCHGIAHLRDKGALVNVSDGSLFDKKTI